MSPEFESLRVVPSVFFYDVSHTDIFALIHNYFTVYNGQTGVATWPNTSVVIYNFDLPFVVLYRVKI